MPSNGDLDTDQGIESERFGSEKTKWFNQFLVMIKTSAGIQSLAKLFELFGLITFYWLAVEGSCSFCREFYNEIIEKSLKKAEND